MSTARDPHMARRAGRIVLRPTGNQLFLGSLARDVMAGTGIGVLAGSWLSIALVQLTSPPGATSDALGLYPLFAAVAMLVPAAASVSGTLLRVAVLATTGLYEPTASPTWEGVAGVAGVREQL